MVGCPRCGGDIYNTWEMRCNNCGNPVKKEYCPTCKSSQIFGLDSRGAEICWKCGNIKNYPQAPPNYQQPYPQPYPPQYPPQQYSQNPQPDKKESFFDKLNETIRKKQENDNKLHQIKQESDEKIDRMRREYEEKMRQKKESQPPPPNPCPVCNAPMQYYEQVHQWYCPNCKKYHK